MTVRGLSYCRGPVKRALDLGLVLPALVLVSPLLVALSLVILATMGPPVLFVQERVGLDGRLFKIVKFRSMRRTQGAGLPITGRDDPRITRVGHILRKAKLDELPQLLNIAAGRMSIVGPRPEVPRYVARYTAVERRVLEVRPGLTDPASLAFRDEEELLRCGTDEAREARYLGEILPRKLALNLDYIERASPALDLGLILKTLAAVVLKAPR